MTRLEMKKWPVKVMRCNRSIVVAALFGFYVQLAPGQSNSLLPDSTAQPAPTVLAKAAGVVGIQRCYRAVDQVSSRLFEHAQRADVVLDWDRGNPDREPFFSLSGLEYGNTSAVVSLTTVPGSTGGCTILAERISSEPISCKEVARSELRGYQGTVLVKAISVYTAPGRPRETVTLVDTPPACLIIRRQVQFRWGEGQ
ncbi:hypothetical protein [Paraburkholderia sp. J12]|uniref:hypothetical protein n=1 Tax=Paraburkholderia sp. J12 TaxID=2805432 RepID=UPI002ABD3ED6|nr:hypothetical protein [Paraburkholderia sp. J12]